jgi:hypothetical protein
LTPGFVGKLEMAIERREGEAGEAPAEPKTGSRRSVALHFYDKALATGV